MMPAAVTAVSAQIMYYCSIAPVISIVRFYNDNNNNTGNCEAPTMWLEVLNSAD